MNDFIDTCGWLLMGVVYLILIVAGVIIVPALISAIWNGVGG